MGKLLYALSDVVHDEGVAGYFKGTTKERTPFATARK
jgi:hypothetical protein